MTYKEALEMNESKNGLDLSELSLENLLELIEEIPGWDYPLGEESVKELARRAGIDTMEFFSEESCHDYSDLYARAAELLGVGI